MASKKGIKLSPVANAKSSSRGIAAPTSQKYMEQLAAAHRDGGSTDHIRPHVSFEYFDSDHECISDWEGHEVKLLFNSLRILCTMTWQEVKQTGVRGAGPGNAGLRYKLVDVRMPLPEYFSEEVRVAEMGCSKGRRFMGVREDATFYIIWLDRNHEEFKE